MNCNRNFENIKESYLFSTIAEKVAAYTAKHPENHIIRMGIGDVTLPLAPAVIAAMRQAVEDMAHKDTFHGYPSEQGEPFLRECIKAQYARHGVALDLSEIFVGDGAKSDIGNIVDLFDKDNRILIPDPVYPVYVDTNILSGNTILYLDATEENGFLPLPHAGLMADIIYLCSPNNPTGAVYDRAGLQAWVDFALEQQAILVFDAAYEAFVSNEELPHSIFEIEGAKRCAIEFCSFSKTAGFTGVRCGYTVISKQLVREGLSLQKMWARRQATKFNGVSYITQCAAAAVFSEDGRHEVRETIDYYRHNAQVMVDAFRDMGLWFTGGEHSPYLWMKCPQGMTSWAFFDLLLHKAEIVGTPGSGFGQNGEGYFRLTAFGDRDETIRAMQRIKSLMKQ